MKLPDAYVLRARVAPVVILSLPLLITFSNYLATSSEWSTIAAVGVVGLAIITLLAQLGRDRGKKLEPALYERWGGKPTTAMLRHRDNRMNAVTKDRLHTRLNQMVEGLSIPDSALEKRDRQQADKLYDSAVYWLRSNTADNTKFARLHEENISYGFRRNLLGLRPIGILLSLGLIGFELAIDRPFESDKVSTFLFQPSILSSMVLLTFLYFIVNQSWVRNAAESYAFALFNAVESMQPQMQPKPIKQ